MVADKSKVRSLIQDPNLHIIFSVTLMAVVGVSSITPAFPKIASELNVDKTQIGLLITVFTLPGIFLNLFLGVLADRLGRKKILVPSLLLFGLAGGACALADTFEVLLVLRFVQGICGAALGALNVTVLGDLYDGIRRTEAMGYNASILSIGTAAFPAIGGAVAMLGWYYPFLISILAIPVGLWVLYGLKNPEPEGVQNIKSYLKNALKSIRKKEVLGLFIASVLTFIIIFGPYLTFLPLFLEEKFGVSTFLIGIVLSASSLTTAIVSAKLKSIAKLMREHSMIRLSFVLYIIAFGMVPLLGEYYLIYIPALIFGVAQGINIPTIHALLADYSPMEYRAAFMSFNGMVLRLGQTLGPVVIGFVYETFGIDETFYAGAVTGLILLIIGFTMIKNQNHQQKV